MFRSYINSTSIRRSLLGATAVLALVAGSAHSNKAQACDTTMLFFSTATPPAVVGSAQVGCGSSAPAWEYKAMAIGVGLEWAHAGYIMVDDCMTRASGKPGKNLGVGQTPVWYFSSDATKAQRKAEEAAYAASPAAMQTCDKATVASKAEIQGENFKLAGIDPTKAAFGATAVNVAQVRRDELNAQYALAMRFTADNYASAR